MWCISIKQPHDVGLRRLGSSWGQKLGVRGPNGGGCRKSRRQYPQGFESKVSQTTRMRDASPFMSGAAIAYIKV